jgi:hypothetical protein
LPVRWWGAHRTVSKEMRGGGGGSSVGKIYPPYKEVSKLPMSMYHRFVERRVPRIVCCVDLLMVGGKQAGKGS